MYSDSTYEIIKVLLPKDPSTEEDDKGDKSDDTHVSDNAFELVLYAKESHGGERDKAYEPLGGRELLLGGPDWIDRYAFLPPIEPYK